MSHQAVIIVAGGVGSRMKSDKPKQFLDLEGEPVIIRTLKCFLAYNSSIRIVISVHKNYKSHLETIIVKHQINTENLSITIGGDTRFESVRNGLQLIDETTAVVGIHDAARPLVSRQTIAACFETATQKGNAVPCVSVNESLRKISNNVNNSVNRLEYKIVQTPQCFQVSKIKAAFAQGYQHSFTDDATVLEAAGEFINLVEGNLENIKITSPHDLILAGAMIRHHLPQ
jgi:2-C-methyl-D-erythritol 4-phosphate cytidylyltransferase